jgi:hypothetical protein
MKRFKINAKLISDIIMSIIMIPFVLISAIIVSFATILHFGIWWINRKL